MATAHPDVRPDWNYHFHFGTVSTRLNPTLFDHPAYASAASVISFSLRAAAANRRALRENETLETYFQTALSDGFINLGEGITYLNRALLVDATKGSSAHHSGAAPAPIADGTDSAIGLKNLDADVQVCPFQPI